MQSHNLEMNNFRNPDLKFTCGLRKEKLKSKVKYICGKCSAEELHADQAVAPECTKKVRIYCWIGKQEIWTCRYHMFI